MKEIGQHSGDKADYSYQPPYHSPQQRQGMSGCAKVFIIFLVVAVLGFVLVCVAGYLTLRNSLTEEPRNVRTIADKIITWEFNQELEPVGGFDFFGYVRGALMAHPDKGTMLVADTSFADANAAVQFSESLQNEQVEQESKFGDEQTEVVQEEQKTITIRGEPITLQFNKTRGQKTKTEYREIMGLIPGNQNPTFVIMKLRIDFMDDESIIERFENLK